MLKRQTLFLPVFLLLLLACGARNEKAIDISSASQSPDSLKLFRKNTKLSVIGDFDGDGRMDTIQQHNYSKLTKSEIDTSLDPNKAGWDSVVRWFYHQESDVYLTARGIADTLGIGPAQGLYCLINIGDNNADGKEEIAFVTDLLDWSRLNTCRIYSLCEGKWTLLKKIDILEFPFDFETDEAPVFTEIENFLEKRNGQWMYSYHRENDSLGMAIDSALMVKLTVDKCR